MYLSLDKISLRQIHNFTNIGKYAGACPGVLKGGSNISCFPKKRSTDFKRGGVQWSDGGSSTLVSLGRQMLHI